MFEQISACLAIACPLVLILFSSCAGIPDFEETKELLGEHTELVILRDTEGGGQVLVAPGYAARVMVSTWGGGDAPRLGWVNEDVVTGDSVNPAFVNYGGADRLWLSPEGGQFALFFKKGDPFDLDHWQTPAAFNNEPYDILEQDAESVLMARDMELENYSGTPFAFRVEREVRLVKRRDLASRYKANVPDSVRFVGFATGNRLINKSTSKMTKKTGLVSIWILGQFDASPRTWTFLPFKSDGEGGTGAYVKDDYFGKVPPERLVVDRGASCAFFKCDGSRRTKVGLSRTRTRNMAGSMDFDRNILTIVSFNLPRRNDYADNSWKIQADPFGGDVINSYNNGLENEEGAVAESFYELETLSPVKPLWPGNELEHVSTTLHFGGTLEELNAISRELLGVDLNRAKLK